MNRRFSWSYILRSLRHVYTNRPDRLSGAVCGWLHSMGPCMQNAKMWQQKADDTSYHPDYSWKALYFGATALLWSHTQDPCFGDKLHFFANSHLNSQNGIQRTPCGLTFVCEWGSCRHAAGAAAVMAIYAQGLLKSNSDDEYAATVMDFARRQVRNLYGECLMSFYEQFALSLQTICCNSCTLQVESSAGSPGVNTLVKVYISTPHAYQWFPGKMGGSRIQHPLCRAQSDIIFCATGADLLHFGSLWPLLGHWLW